MNHSRQYVIKLGDTLYNLAKRYNTTVPLILSQNPSIDPQNLQVGTLITISPGENMVHTNNLVSSVCPDPSRQIALISNMRNVWVQHVYWTRMLIISIIEKLKDQNAVTVRLMQNPNDKANIFADYYSTDIINKIIQLLTEHMQIGVALITALRDGKTEESEILNRKWYINADKMAVVFNSINPNYNLEDLRNMLHTHLDLTKQEVAMRLAGNYQTDVAMFDKAEQEALLMADYFSLGIMKQFPQKFK